MGSSHTLQLWLARQHGRGINSTELERQVWIQEAFRDKSSGFDRCLVGHQDLAAPSPSTRPCHVC